MRKITLAVLGIAVSLCLAGSAFAAGATKDECVVYLWADELAKAMKFNVHFTFDQKKQKIPKAMNPSARIVNRYGPTGAPATVLSASSSPPALAGS